MAKFASRVIIDRLRYLVLAVSLFACASAQVHEVSAELPVGTISARLMLTLPSVPYAKDSISVDCSSGRVRFAVVTPDGRRINAEDEGLLTLMEAAESLHGLATHLYKVRKGDAERK